MKIIKKTAACALSLFIMLSVGVLFASGAKVPSYKYSDEQIIGIAKKAADFAKGKYGAKDNLFDGDFLQNSGTVTGDWYVIALNRLGFADDYGAYLDAVENDVLQRYDESGGLSSQKATEWHRISLAILCSGGNPQNVCGIDLINDGVFNRSKAVDLGKQGVNAYIWALITADSKKFLQPQDCSDSRSQIIKNILSSQLANGSFSSDGRTSDTDITAMALTALAPYRNTDGEVSKAVNSALDFLHTAQEQSGGFSSTDGENCETTAQALIALCSLGINSDADERFIKNGTVIDSLLSYQNSDGGFAHIKNGESEHISTQQALCALAAYYRLSSNLKPLYDFTDLSVNQTDVDINSLAASANEILKKSEQSKSTVYLQTADRLILALEGKSFENKDSILSGLRELKKTCEKLQSDIDKLNQEINELAPFESISSAEKEKIASLYAQTEKLSDYDKTKITYLEQLRKAHTQLVTSQRTAILTAAFSVVLVLLVVFVICNIKRIKNRKKKQMQELANKFGE